MNSIGIAGSSVGIVVTVKHGTIGTSLSLLVQCEHYSVNHLAPYFSRRNGAIKTEMLSTVAIFRKLT